MCLSSSSLLVRNLYMKVHKILTLSIRWQKSSLSWRFSINFIPLFEEEGSVQCWPSTFYSHWRTCRMPRDFSGNIRISVGKRWCVGHGGREESRRKRCLVNKRKSVCRVRQVTNLTPLTPRPLSPPPPLLPTVTVGVVREWGLMGRQQYWKPTYGEETKGLRSLACLSSPILVYLTKICIAFTQIHQTRRDLSSTRILFSVLSITRQKFNDSVSMSIKKKDVNPCPKWDVFAV